VEQSSLDVEVYEWPAPKVLCTKGGWRVELRCELVQSVRQLYAMREVLMRCPDITYDSETSGLDPHQGARIVGHAFAAATDENIVTAWYLPVRHIGGENDAQEQLDPELAASVVQEILSVIEVMGKPARCGFHHAKFDVSMLLADGVRTHRAQEDVSISATIANENERSMALKSLAAKYCIAEARDEEGALKDWMRRDARRLGIKFRERKRSADQLEEPSYLERFGYARAPLQLCGAYACRDVFYTLYLWLVKYEGVPTLYPEVWQREHRVGKILQKMEWVGLPVNEALIRDSHDRSAAEVAYWLSECRRLSRPGFTGTDAELRELFYTELGMRMLRFTKGGKGGKDKAKKPSVDKTARRLLQKRYPEHEELLEATLRLARARKLHGTYSGNFLRYLANDGRIHPSYNQMERREKGGVPVTGRLSSADPSVQNLDSRALHLHDCRCGACMADDPLLMGPSSIISVREYFTVPPGFVRLYIDFRQVELRTLTWLCQDKTLLYAFQNDLDLHQIIADELGIPRKVAKQVNFGNSFGMTKVGLAVRLPGYFDDPEGTEALAERVLERYFARYSRILQFRASYAREMCRKGGMFISPFGRPRRIPTISSPKQWERERAERMMMSSVVSGMAADIMKESMIRCDGILDQYNAANDNDPRQAELVQSIHDELVFDVPHVAGWARLLIRLVRAMEDWPSMAAPPDREGVPIRVSIELTNTTWAAKREVVLGADDSLLWAV